MEPPGTSPGHERTLYVLYTSTHLTLSALNKAREWANAVCNTFTLLVIQEVPFVLPLEYPPVQMEFIIKHFHELSWTHPEPLRLRAYLCRNREETLKQILDLNTPLVIAAGKIRQSDSDRKLARKLRREGYPALLVEVD